MKQRLIIERAINSQMSIPSEKNLHVRTLKPVFGLKNADVKKENKKAIATKIFDSTVLESALPTCWSSPLQQAAVH